MNTETCLEVLALGEQHVAVRGFDEQPLQQRDLQQKDEQSRDQQTC